MVRTGGLGWSPPSGWRHQQPTRVVVLRLKSGSHLGLQLGDTLGCRVVRDVGQLDRASGWIGGNALVVPVALSVPPGQQQDDIDDLGVDAGLQKVLRHNIGVLDDVVKPGRAALQRLRQRVEPARDGVEEVGVQALSGCPSLESVQLPEAVRIYNAAFMASGLTSLSLPETTRLGYSAFQHCDALTELRLTAAGNITLEMDSGATPFSPNFAKVCDLTLNADKHYSTGTAAPKAASADQWATNYYGDPLTWKSIAFE